MSITAHDGWQAGFLQPTRKGDPELPLSGADLDDRFMELTVPAVGDAKARRLLSGLWRLECAPSLDLFGS